jgi:hypothetical protein
MRALLAILIAFVLLSLGSAAIVFLYEHLSGFAIFNSQTWQSVRIPAIVSAVIMGLALLVVTISLSNKKHERALKEFALAQGWGYSVRSNDPEGVIPKISTILERVSPEIDFDVATVMTVRHEKGNLFLFSCSYVERRSRNKSRPGSACLIESARLRGMASQVDIVQRTAIDSALMLRQVDMGDFEFARSYIVSSRDSDEAVKSINESMKAILVEYSNSPDFNGNFQVALGPGGAVILRWAQVLPEEWLPLLDMARHLESAMK